MNPPTHDTFTQALSTHANGTPGSAASIHPVSLEHSNIQVIQTHFRQQIARNWPIAPGARVLEIGCGQGDMTAVLAKIVGDQGHVTAVDVAPPEYGGPLTLGQATTRLLASPLGPRMDFRFNFDVLDPAHAFAPDAFDCVVLAHCSWYFSSLDRLADTLRRVRPWARRLCYSEWDMEPQALAQTGHLLSILIQGQVEAYKAHSSANVRTPFSPATLQALLAETGWFVSNETSLDTAELQDGGWEIAHCARATLSDMETLEMPPKLQLLLRSQMDVLRSLAERGLTDALPSYALVAERTPVTMTEP